jgi:hypothetical protein
MDTQSIMVQITDRRWTLAAMHLACALAREAGAEVALIKLVPVQHVGWLNTDFGYLQLTADDRKDMRDYQTIAEDYGVQSSRHFYQYATLPGAIVDAAAYVNAQAVFATLPSSIVPLWRKVQLWWLRRSLKRQQCELYTLEPPINASDWTPSVLIQPSEDKQHSDKQKTWSR